MTDDDGRCGHCGDPRPHPGTCPRVKAVEYYPDGVTVRRVEYWEEMAMIHQGPVCPDGTTLTRVEE